MQAFISAVILSLIYLVLSFFNLVGSVHGTESLPLFTLVYLIVSYAVVWLFYLFTRKSNATKKIIVFYVVWGIVSILSGLFLWQLAARFDQYKMLNRTIGIKITDIKDELYTSKKGNPVGIKVQLSIQVPEKNNYNLDIALTPSQIPQYWDNSIVQQRIINVTVDPSIPPQNLIPIIYPLQKDINYRLTFYTVPKYLVPQAKGSFCIVSPPQSLVALAEPLRYQLNVLYSIETFSQPTSNLYSLKDIYQGIQQEQFPPCPANTSLSSGDLKPHVL